jgi:RNA polymerase sigma-70 factor, ECF subfamily
VVQSSRTDSSWHEQEAALLSDEPTIDLVVQARGGDRMAVEALLERCMPPLKRWAHGRLPTAARGHLDTGDLVQDSAMNLVARFDVFEPRHVGAMQAYLRQAVINRIRDEVRRVTRRPAPLELEDYPSDASTPLETTIQVESYQRYRQALMRLRSKDRELILARIEMQWNFNEIVQRFGLPTVSAARMAMRRAERRLAEELKH